MNVSLSSAARSWSRVWNGIMAAASASQAPITTHLERGPAASLASRPSMCGGHYGKPPPPPARHRVLAALPDLQPVAVGVLELRHVAPGELEHVRDELDAARLQLLERLPDIVGLDRDRRRGASHRRLGLPRCPGPENQLEVVPLDADGQKPRPAGCRVLNALLKAKDVRVEVERLALVADEHARVEDLLQHCCSSGGRGHYTHDTRRAVNVTAEDAWNRRARARAAESRQAGLPR